MAGVPDTKLSLILRLRDHDDAVAWREFTTIYEPVIRRVARRYGLQSADAEETVQEVLVAVARAVSDWEPDGPARFRGWLMRIVRNKLIDHLRRCARRTSPVGGFQAGTLEQQADHSEGLSVVIEREYRQQLFRWAAGIVRQQVQQKTWQAFWLSSVEGQSAAQAAQATGLSVGAVYIARSRVLARLRAVIETRQQQTQSP